MPVTVGKNSQYSVGVFQDTAKGFTVYNYNKWYTKCNVLFALCYEMQIGLQISRVDRWSSDKLYVFQTCKTLFMFLSLCMILQSQEC